LLNLAGIVGGLIIAVIGDRTDTPRAIAFAYIAGAVGCGALSLLAPAVSSVFLLCAVAGLLCVGAQMCLVSVAAAIYPLHLRAGAIGLMMAMGRVGAVIGPLVGGALIGGSDGYFHLALCVAVGCLIAGAAIAVLPRRA
jgi:AAHS family 4-hydroxybenzoate transporter-like MFS transporter